MQTNLRIKWEQKTLPIGEELDKLIAQMMGVEQKAFSTDDREALQVIEWLRQQKWLVVVKWMPDDFNFQAGNDGPEIPQWRRFCELMWMPANSAENMHRQITLHPFGVGATAAEAICRVALGAVYDYFRYEMHEGRGNG